MANASHPKTWIVDLIGDLVWLWNRHPDLKGLEQPCLTNLQVWFRFITCSKARWKKIVGSVVRAITDCEVPDTDELLTPQSVFTSVECELCGLIVKDNRGLACHKRKAHGHQAHDAPFADSDGICWTCGLDFHVRTRLRGHLQNGFRAKGAESCLGQLLHLESVHAILPLCQEYVVELNEQDRVRHSALRKQGRSVAFAERPVFKPNASEVEVPL
jgi:hypothetical protein